VHFEHQLRDEVPIQRQPDIAERVTRHRRRPELVAQRAMRVTVQPERRLAADNQRFDVSSRSLALSRAESRQHYIDDKADQPGHEDVLPSVDRWSVNPRR